MTAGRGILHAEMPCSEEPAHGLQLWVNLRSSEKMVAPQYQELKNDEIPKPSLNGVTVSVISGEALGVKVTYLLTSKQPTHRFAMKIVLSVQAVL